ncbi:Rha family transcriptional regulator [Methylovulum psychrotolerans]|uniref:Rha family transcriptional regulator n=1 Tax=Methylovulum psychrotolerans TaxID=1704499 RepID=UPI001BFF2788|nr:Rha family transcriptional regulator [Methylovulum psychrotolerans]MBT9097440.1 Rha family transcriptional regulator [Methylovulum psychrotolerans]
MSKSLYLPEQFVFAHGQELVTTSLKVAERFGKRHDNVIRDIDKVLTQVSESFGKLNFEETEYEKPNNLNLMAKHRSFNLTKDGFMFLVMGFTGKDAAAIKEWYINAFNQMYDKLFPRSAPTQQTLLPEPPTITKKQAGELSAIVANKSRSSGKPKAYYWSRYQNHFKIAKYGDTPADKFDAAHDYLLRLEGDNDPLLTLSQAELEALLQERINALPSPAKEGELLPNPTKDDLIGILTRQITALEAQLQAAQNLSPTRMILALKQEGHLVIEKGQDLPGQIVMHYVSPKRLTQLIHCATERLENFLREEVANA